MCRVFTCSCACHYFVVSIFFSLYVVFTLVHMRFQQYTIYQGYPLLQNPHADK